jgi:hypothetical protein
MIEPNEARRLSLRSANLADEVLRQESDPPLGAPSLLAKTTVLSAYPTIAQSYYACKPLILLGTESEGNLGVITEVDSIFLALNIGKELPPIGTRILTTFVGNRWVFRHDA